MNSMMKHFQLTDKDLNQQISDCHIAEISDSFCEKWRLLPPYLELEDIVEKDVDREHQGSDESEKRCSFLKKWKKIIGLKATYKMLISALLRVKCRNEAEGVCKLLKKHTATGSHQAGQEQSDSSASPKASNAISEL